MSHPHIKRASRFALGLVTCCVLSFPARAQSARLAPETVPGPGPHNPYPASSPVADDHTQGGWMPRKGAISGALRLGFSAPAKGTSSLQCSADCGALPDSMEVDVTPSYLVGGDLLWQVSEHLRVGAGANLVGGSRLESRESDLSLALGPQVQALSVMEGVFSVTADSFLTLRGQVGLLLQTVSTSHDEALGGVRDNCAEIPECSFKSGPYVGYVGGLGFGLLMVAGGTRFRVDLLGEIAAVPLSEMTMDDDVQEVSMSEVVLMNRAWLNVGFEL